MKLTYTFPLILITLFFSCNTNKVTKTKDYNAYITTKIDASAVLASTQIWTDKLEATPDQFPYLAKRASTYKQLFNATGNIDYLIKAENDLIKTIEITNGKNASYLKSLATNYISQHRFKAALDLLKQAEEIGDKLNGTQKMLFDVHLELGNYIYAESYLNDIKNTSDFDYLIRLAKWEDHKGNLDGAIVQMEKATAIAESSNLKSIKQWAYTNLADFYGHAGAIEKSYDYYLKALALDPNDAYAKKGIAWILYSHENNTEEALRILDHISSYYKAPDYDLLKAEIADYSNDTALKSQAMRKYKDAVGNEQYGDMYNKYNVMVYADDMLLPEQALEIAQREVENRPTPQSYDLLAWCYFKKGNIEKANVIMEEFVEAQTSEPAVLYHMAEIYKAAGKTEKVTPLKQELVASFYELGPTMTAKIKKPVIMKKQILALLIFGCFSLIITAQNIKGVVVNERNQPLEAAYVYNSNSKNHTHTSENGVFAIQNTKQGDSVRIGLLGYRTKFIVIDSNTDLKVTLEEKSFQLDELVITEELNAVSTISRLDLNITPVNSSQEVLRKVPGLFIGQHAGGGKAEQIFLRGFDIDHGTDVSISVDGMPVNMVSHAHGQGYSDLHFVIPETINKIDFGKGAYYAAEGDFNTAGYVNFKTKDYLKESSISVSAGQFNTLRTVGMFDLLETAKNQNAYLAMEYIATDGPFESSQNFNRLNLFGKYVMFLPDNNKLTLTASHFTSRWDASGQIPQREVDNGNITRFGAIDDTEGGFTERTNFNVTYDKYISDNTKLSTNAFYSHYAFELYSNFTFFLEDPVNGDQIKQVEDRNIFGVNTTISHSTFLGETELNITSGLGIRHDVVDDVELSRTLNRSTTLENIQLGDINQTNIDAFVNAEFDFGKFKIAPALRLDYFKFLYNDALQTNYETQSETKTILSPKLNFFYNAKENLQLYLKSGLGFHSNDARVVVANGGEDILPRSYGTDLGSVWKPFPKLVVNSALWYLFLEQEFVYIGDAGIVEPSGKTRRFGLDLGLRYQLTNWLFLDTDATFTNARSIEDPKGQNYIPLAPDFTLTSGLAVDNLDGFSGGLRFRYLDDRPANEDNSIVAEGYLVTDFNINYEFNAITFGLAVENLFDVDWNETQFATESRLQNEAQSVEEIHFTPGTPFFIKATVSYRF